MADDDLGIHHKEPPDTPESWQRLHRAAWRADQTWLISRPIVAVVSNWKALAAIVVILAWINRPEIIAAIKTIVGAMP